MKESPTLAAYIASWTREAVEIWGDDWTRICTHIERRMASLPLAEQRLHAWEIAVTLVGADEGAKH